jgi:NAD-dependent dihydropyrimidine dehydrogenase PreA subunit
VKYLADAPSLKMVSEKCTGCGMCLEVCPHNVFAIRDKKAVIIDKDRCMECGACAVNCAFGALSVDKGVGCAAAIINSIIKGGEPVCGCGNNNDSSGCC